MRSRHAPDKFFLLLGIGATLVGLYAIGMAAEGLYEGDIERFPSRGTQHGGSARRIARISHPGSFWISVAVHTVVGGLAVGGGYKIVTLFVRK